MAIVTSVPHGGLDYLSAGRHWRRCRSATYDYSLVPTQFLTSFPQNLIKWQGTTFPRPSLDTFEPENWDLGARPVKVYDSAALV